MNIPVLSAISELDPAPRRFLGFVCFNVLSWQCIVGPVLVLFARSIEMPPSWVGVLISMLPLSMLLVALTIHLVTRWGPKRVMFTAWIFRYLFVSLVFIMPWAMARWGDRSAWHVLLIATLGFCLVRAIGAGSWFPWLHDIVPATQRATYFSTETSISQIINVAVAFTLGALLKGTPSMGRFLSIYAVGVSAGLTSLVWMAKIPGGAGLSHPITMRQSFSSYRVPLNDRAFLGFVALGTACICCMNWLSASLVMYMRDAVGMSSKAIMYITAMGSLGILLTIRSWERFSNHHGSGHTMALTLTAYSISALMAIFMIPGASWTPIGLLAVVSLSSLFNAAFWVAALRTLMGYLQQEYRAGYNSVWTVMASLASGLTPILVGQVIHRWGLQGFRLCFLITGLGGLACAVATRFRVENVVPVPASMMLLFHPSLRLRTLARIAWITLGFHESNSALPPPATTKPRQGTIDKDPSPT